MTGNTIYFKFRRFLEKFLESKWFFVVKRFQNIVFLVLIMLLVFFVSWGFFERKQAHEKISFLQARLDLVEFVVALEKYRVVNGGYPLEEEGLSVLFHSKVLSWPAEGYFRGLTSEITDPWGSDYRYSRKSRPRYIIRSPGPDGVDSCDDIFYSGKGGEREELEKRINKLENAFTRTGFSLILSLVLVFLLLFKVVFDTLRVRREGARVP